MFKRLWYSTYVQHSKAIAVRVVSNLMVIPDRDPRELLMRKLQIKIRPVGGVPSAEIV